MKNGSSVLLYNMAGTTRGRKIKFILVQLGARIINVEKEEYLKSIGELLKITPPTETVDYEGEGFSEEMLVMEGFTGKQIDELSMRMRKSKMERINLKAVVTETNQFWNSIELYEELKKEHEKMNAE